MKAQAFITMMLFTVNLSAAEPVFMPQASSPTRSAAACASR